MHRVMGPTQRIVGTQLRYNAKNRVGHNQRTSQLVRCILEQLFPVNWNVWNIERNIIHY